MFAAGTGPNILTAESIIASGNRTLEECNHSQTLGIHTFFRLDTKESIKERVKPAGKMTANFSATLKQIIHVSFPPC